MLEQSSSNIWAGNMHYLIISIVCYVSRLPSSVCMISWLKKGSMVYPMQLSADSSTRLGDPVEIWELWQHKHLSIKEISVSVCTLTEDL